MKIKFYLSSLFLVFFGALFFTSDFYLPHIKKWKSQRLLFLTKVYSDSSIDTAGTPLKDAIRKARVAHLLDPKNQEAEENYLLLLLRISPTKALQKWANSPLLMNSESGKNKLLKLCLHVLKKENLSPEKRSIIASNAFGLTESLEQKMQSKINPENALLIIELLTECGYSEIAYQRLDKILQIDPNLPQAVFLQAKLTVLLKKTDKLFEISTKLVSLSSQKNETGVEAIRHLTLVHSLIPLSRKALESCIDILKSNPYKKPIDFLRVYALMFSTSESSATKKDIIAHCYSFFQKGSVEELLVFSSWLAKIGAFEYLIHYLPAKLARTDEKLFKVRMNALAQIGDSENIYAEVKNAPIIPSVWKLVVQARAYSLEGKANEAKKTFDRLIPVIVEDPRKVRSVCFYLEETKDLTSLVHVLEKLIERPVHQKFALDKLIQYRYSSASLENLLNWISKLKEFRKQDPILKNAFLYFKLLDTKLPSPSKQMTDLVSQAISQNSNWQTKQSQITLALAHLRNGSPDLALVALGRAENWRKWGSERPAWAYICSQVYAQNHASEKAILLKKKAGFEKMDFAERNSLKSLFTKNLIPL